MNFIEEIEFCENQISQLQSQMGFGSAASVKDSGEIHALEYAFARLPDNCDVVDVGSHHGQFLDAAYHPRMQFHCFEASPTAFEVLKRKYEDTANVKLNNCAIIPLSEGDCEMTLWSHSKGDGISSLVKRDISHLKMDYDVEERVQTITLQRYLEKNNHFETGYLKLDTEGTEYEILYNHLADGFFPMFVQFEYGFCNVDSRTYLRDFYLLLKDEYNIFRIHPKGLYPCNQYKESYENFHLINFLCELKK